MMKDSKDVEVKCARIMLDKVIAGMERDPKAGIPVEVFPAKEQKHREKSHDPEYMVHVEHGILLDIKCQGEHGTVEAPLDLAIEVDGEITTYEKAKGKSFQTGRII